jgi:hypothetical protein
LNYENADPIPNKTLNPDGSISTLDGTLVSPANAEGAQRWLLADPIPNKWLNPDGTITSTPTTKEAP